MWRDASTCNAGKAQVRNIRPARRDIATAGDVVKTKEGGKHDWDEREATYKTD